MSARLRLFSSNLRGLWRQFQSALSRHCYRRRFFKEWTIPASPFVGRFGGNGSVPAHVPSAPAQGRTAFRIVHAEPAIMGPSGIYGVCRAASRCLGNRLAGIPGPLHYTPRPDPHFSPGFAARRRRRACMQGARREGDAGILDSMSRSPTERNAADMPGSAAAVELW